MSLGSLHGALIGPPAALRSMVPLGGPGNTYAMASLNTGFVGRFMAASALDVKAVRLRWTAVTTPGTVQLRVETIDPTTGKPTGNLYDPSAVYDITPAAGVQTYTFATLPTAGRTVGTEYAIVLLTTGAGTTQTFDAYSNAASAHKYPSSVMTAADGTTRTNFAEVNNACPCLSLVLEDDSEESAQFNPWTSEQTLHYIYGTVAPAGKVTVPVALSMAGVDFFARRVGTPAGDMRVRVLDEWGTLVTGTDVTLDKDTLANAGTSGRIFQVLFPAPIEFAAGVYYIVLSSASSASTSNCYFTTTLTHLAAGNEPSGYRVVTTTDITATPPVWTEVTTGAGYFAFVVDAPSDTAPSGSLCTIAAVKEALKITTTDKDSLVSDLVAEATAWIEGECSRTFASTSYTEIFSPGRDDRILRGGTIIQPRNYPIISVTSLHQSSVRTFDATTLIAATDYAIAQGSLKIELLDDGATMYLTNGQRTVQLVYTAGYATIPADLQRAAVMCAVHLFYKADRQKQNVASESLGGVTVSYQNEKMPKEAQAIVNRYRRLPGL